MLVAYPSNPMEILTKDTFEAFTQKPFAIVDFWAPWCGPCRKLAPVLEQIQNEFIDSVKIVKIDTDKNINSAKEYGISSLPSVLLFKDGEVKEVMVGMMPKSAIVSNIKKLIILTIIILIQAGTLLSINLIKDDEIYSNKNLYAVFLFPLSFFRNS